MWRKKKKSGRTNNHQTQTLWQMPTIACWQEPDIAVSCESLPVPGKYRSGFSHSSIGQSTGSPMKELEKVPKELNGSAAPWEEQQYELTSTPQSSQGLNHQPKSTHGGTRGSSCICSRGWPSRSSMGGEVLGPLKALCPSVGEWLGQEVGVGGLVSRRSEERIGGFWRGNQERGQHLKCK